MKSLKFKSFGVGCNHLIELPNGKTILVDPYFYYDESVQFSKNYAYGFKQRDEIERVDYIMISHVHFDHAMDLSYFVEKWNSKIFVGALSASELIKEHKIPYDNIFTVTHNQELIFDDFTLYAYQAKHNSAGGKIYDVDFDMTFDYIGVKGYKGCGHVGSFESLNFLVVTKQNLSILFAPGETHDSYIQKICRERYPNVVFRQASVRETTGEDAFGKQVPPQKLAEIFSMYGGQLAVPFHFDALKRTMTEQEVASYFAQVKEHFEELNPACKFLFPELNKWYNFGVCAELA